MGAVNSKGLKTLLSFIYPFINSFMFILLYRWVYSRCIANRDPENEKLHKIFKTGLILKCRNILAFNLT